MSQGQNYYQKQQYQSPQQFQLEAQQRLYQDMNNVLGTCMEFVAVQKNNNTTLKDIFHNRTILQINISNAIHVDDFNSSNQLKCEAQLRQWKKEALTNFKSARALCEQSNVDFKNCKEVQTQLNYYETNCLSQNPKLIQQPQLEIKQEQQFNQQTIEKLIMVMSNQDAQNQNLMQQYQNNSKIFDQLKDPKTMYNKANSRFINALDKVHIFNSSQQKNNSQINQQQYLEFDENTQRLLGAIQNMMFEKQDTTLFFQAIQNSKQQDLILRNLKKDPLLYEFVNNILKSSLKQNAQIDKSVFEKLKKHKQNYDLFLQQVKIEGNNFINQLSQKNQQFNYQIADKVLLEYIKLLFLKSNIKNSYLKTCIQEFKFPKEKCFFIFSPEQQFKENMNALKQCLNSY